VLEHLTFALPAGSLTALVGPNGAGKSSLLQAIAGQLPLAEGRIVIDGEPQGAALKRPGRLALMPQRSEMAWHFPITVRALVALGLMAGKVAQAPCCQVDGALQRVGLQDLAQRRLDQLSGGQQQRALLARALVGQAPLLLLDEPCAAIDPPSRTALLAVLAQLRDAGLTLLVSSHDWGSDLEAYDRVLVLDRHLLAQGTPAQVRQTLGDLRLAPHGCG
jgi:zinc/manganese transport system ATP-binding protein